MMRHLGAPVRLERPLAGVVVLELIRAKVERGERILVDEAVWLHEHADDAALRELSAKVRARFSPPDQATYLIMAIVNTTNVCVAKCDYCAFYVLPKQPGGYLLTVDELKARVDKLLGFGGTVVGFNGGFNPDVRLEEFEVIFRELRQSYGDRLEFYGLTIAEFMYACKVSKVPYLEGARRMKASGLRWITGGGAEVLADAFRKRHSPLKYRVDDFYDAQRAVIEAGVGSTATMVIGFDETLDERMEHLSRLRTFQDSVGGALTSFLCWTYKPYHTSLGGKELDTQAYLRWLAISRIFLDNIAHIRTSVLTKNADALIGLAYGADDFDLPTEDEVTEKAGATISLDFERLLDAARVQGFTPIHREPWPVRGATA